MLFSPKYFIIILLVQHFKLLKETRYFFLLFVAYTFAKHVHSTIFICKIYFCGHSIYFFIYLCFMNERQNENSIEFIYLLFKLLSLMICLKLKFFCFFFQSKNYKRNRNGELCIVLMSRIWKFVYFVVEFENKTFMINSYSLV